MNVGLGRKRRLKNPITLLPYKAIVALTICCWFGSLTFSHYQLSLALVDQQFKSAGAKGATESNPTFLDAPQTRENTNENTPIVQVDALSRKTLSPLLADQDQEITETSQFHRGFLIFEAEALSGQGAGNLLNGLLAAHLLGIEYNRTVCVVPEWHFHHAFELIDTDDRAKCDEFFQQNPKNEMPEENQITMVNFMNPPDECQLQETLASKERDAIYIRANTYCRWRTVPPKFFLQLYKPKQQLLDLLPYQASPKTVVHLRMPDGERDKTRKGLDEESLVALGELLAKHNETPYLVSNHALWFDYFEKEWGWSHPPWERVTHSALKIKNWGSRRAGNSLSIAEEKKQQRMQLWVDWYTILQAGIVYHTHSDFSLSAIHWMGSYRGTNDFLTFSRTILGVDPKTKQLQLTKESFVEDTPMPRLIDRAGKELAHCATKASSGPIDNKTSHDKQRLNLDLSAPATQAFIQKSLSITDSQRERYNDWKRTIEDINAERERHLDVAEITAKVSKALKK